VFARLEDGDSEVEKLGEQEGVGKGVRGSEATNRLVAAACIALGIAGMAIGSPPKNPVIHPFDPTTRVILTGDAAATLLKMEGAGRDWRAEPWDISSKDLDRLERDLLPGLAADLKTDEESLDTKDYYRQFAAARWKQYHVILVNGFTSNLADVPGPKEHWKHSLVMVLDGGCSFWRTAYVVEQRRFLLIDRDGSGRKTIACNGVA
jgi:hypothetical protein